MVNDNSLYNVCDGVLESMFLGVLKHDIPPTIIHGINVIVVHRQQENPNK